MVTMDPGLLGPLGSCDAPLPMALGDEYVRVTTAGPTEPVFLGVELTRGRRYAIEYLPNRETGVSPFQVRMPQCGDRVYRFGFKDWPPLEYEAVQTGLHSIRFQSQNAISSVVRVRDVGPATDVVGSTPESAGLLPLGGRVVRGQTDGQGDVDVYTLTVPARSTVTLAMMHTSQIAYTSMGYGDWPLDAYRTHFAFEPHVWSNTLVQNTSDVAKVVYCAVYRPWETGDTTYYLRAYFPDCRGDWDGSGAATFEDVLAFLHDFFAGASDFNGDTRSEVLDLFEFLNAWFAVCER